MKKSAKVVKMSVCTKCFGSYPTVDFLRNDYVCNGCSSITPSAKWTAVLKKERRARRKSGLVNWAKVQGVQP